MNPQIRRRIHAFRNALVLAADTRSHECFQMGRWHELNHFPYGCCDLASNFLAQYLTDGDPTLNPVIVHMLTTPEFREKTNSTIHSHVIVEMDSWYIDLTLNQFEEHNDRVLIDSRTGSLGSLLRKIKCYGGEVNERGIQLHTRNKDGGRLYTWLRDVADSLLGPSDATAVGGPV